MSEPQHQVKPPPCAGIRWWPGVLIVMLAGAAVVWVRFQGDWPFQKRNLTTFKVLAIAAMLLPVWWTFFSRAAKRLRLGVTLGVAGLGLAGFGLFRIGGVTGDLVPILEWRWSTRPAPGTGPSLNPSEHQIVRHDFPQFLGPNRNGVLDGPVLDTNWVAHPPEVLWRIPVGAAWSGFVVVNQMAITQEQHGEDECVIAYDLATGRERWRHADAAHYDTTIAGEGPRTTPTVTGERVIRLGATGILNCLELATGKLLWKRNLIAEAGGKIPSWGVASSPLLVRDLVIVHGGEEGQHCLLAFHLEDGTPAWQGGVANPSYASPILAYLAGTNQIVAFDDGFISAHSPDDGATLWQRPWGNGNVVCSSPIVVGTNRVLFSSGYGVGAELIEVNQSPAGRLTATQVWKSIRMKSKFGHLFTRDGFLYGLDDGIFACVDLRDGSQRWKEGRYGHGQGLLVGDYYLLMAEMGELLLLHPTPDGPNELARFRVFDTKTWNPLALADDLLLVRNDREAACLHLPLASQPSLRDSAGTSNTRL